MKLSFNTVFGPFGIVVLCLQPGITHAVDGVVLIDQARALAGGVTPGDSPGFPVTLSRPGSYRLAGNLVVDAATTTGIEAAVAGVTVDLNGFEIRGPLICAAPGSCAPVAPGGTDVGRGVKGAYRVYNGSVTGMGGTGIQAEIVHDVVVSGNGDIGASCSVCERIVANRNNTTGIWTGEDFGRPQALGTVVSCVASGNGAMGIFAHRASVTSSVATGNGKDGIRVVNGSVAISVSTDNRENGVLAQDSTITNSLFSKNLGNGVLGTSSVVLGNTISSNGLRGLAVSPLTAYGNNLIRGNGAANSVAGAFQLGTNVCDNGLCP
jgi:hypothetical protein